MVRADYVIVLIAAAATSHSPSPAPAPPLPLPYITRTIRRYLYRYSDAVFFTQYLRSLAVVSVRCARRASDGRRRNGC